MESNKILSPEPALHLDMIIVSSIERNSPSSNIINYFWNNNAISFQLPISFRENHKGIRKKRIDRKAIWFFPKESHRDREKSNSLWRAIVWIICLRIIFVSLFFLLQFRFENFVLVFLGFDVSFDWMIYFFRNTNLLNLVEIRTNDFFYII